MLIAGIVKSSLVDYPGLVACVLFVPGCNYNCFYCHNRSLINRNHILLNTAYVMDFLKKRSSILDGVVISGGEPTLQLDLIPFIKQIKEFGFQVKLDTNGSSFDMILQLLQADLCDYYAVDYKAPVKKYQEICGRQANAEDVLQTVGLLLDYQANFEVRTTVIPQLNEEDLICMAKELPVVPRYVLNRYRKPEIFLPVDQARIEQTPYLQTNLDKFVTLIKPYQPHILT